MQLTTFQKGLVMAIVTLLANTVASTGLPATGTAWAVFGITTVGTVLIYLAKNAVFPSVSVLGQLDLQDLLSGLFLALGAGVSNWAADMITKTTVDWASLSTLAGTVVLGYFVKNFASQVATPPSK
jgi:hypothetical protein